MKVSLILAHPDPASLSHALARSVTQALFEKGHELRIHDLYKEGFDPRLSATEIATHRSNDPTVERHARELGEADGLILVHPVWFDAPPAILKGWVDRVVRQGTAYERPASGGFRGLLRARFALLVTTANAPYDEHRGDALDRFWTDFVLAAAGIGDVERVHLTPVVASDLATRRRWLDKVADRAARLAAGR